MRGPVSEMCQIFAASMMSDWHSQGRNQLNVFFMPHCSCSHRLEATRPSAVTSSVPSFARTLLRSSAVGSKRSALKPSRGLSLRSSSEWHGEVGSKGGKRGTRCSPPQNTQQRSMSCRGLEGRGVLAQPLNLVESFLPKVYRNQVCPSKVPFTATWGSPPHYPGVAGSHTLVKIWALGGRGSASRPALPLSWFFLHIHAPPFWISGSGHRNAQGEKKERQNPTQVSRSPSCGALVPSSCSV